jgi:hypothetical protein
MPIPWLFALRAIPWANLLANAPAIADAADALLSGTKTRKAGAAATADEMRGLSERLTALEGHDRADAELLKRISDQVAALTRATEVLAARQRWLLAIAVIALVLGMWAVVVAIR